MQSFKLFTIKNALLSSIVSFFAVLFVFDGTNDSTNNNTNNNANNHKTATNKITDSSTHQQSPITITATTPTATNNNTHNNPNNTQKTHTAQNSPQSQQKPPQKNQQQQPLGEWVEASSFATDKRNLDRDGLAGIEPIISKAPFTCTPSHKLIKLGPDCNNVKKANYYQPNNTTLIDAQVFIPRHRKGEKLPVIVHSHGYGSSKLAELKEIPACDPSQQPYDCPLGENEGMKRFQGMFEQSEKMLTEMVDKGYIVVSYSQRGFGESEGDIMMMNPYHETQDGIAVLDWIAKQGKQGNLPIDVDDNNDFKVGLLGGSYGGGFQFPLSALDSRIDTIVPIGTWNSISRSLMPNGVTKGGWGNLLCMMTIGKNQHHYIQDTCRRIANTSIRTQKQIDPNNKISDYVNQSGLAYFQQLEQNHLPFRDGEEPFKMRPVDTLLIQGLRDVLFDGEEVTRNYQYLKSAGGDVRMLTNQNGHISPFANQNSTGTMNCGSVDMYRAMRIWFDVKLRDKPESLLNEIPTMCLSLDNNTAVNLDSMPDKDMLNNRTPNTKTTDTNITDIKTTDTSTPNNPIINVVNSNNTQVLTKFFNLEIGNLRSPIKCEPIYEVTKDNQVLAGRVQLQNMIVKDDTLVKAGVAYMGLCLQRDGKTTLIDDVLTGFPAGYHREANFVTVGEKLQKGDKIGVMGYKDHVQMFAFGPSFVPNMSALVLQGFKPGASSTSQFVDDTLPNSDWASVGLFSINAFSVTGDISLPIMDNPTLHSMD